MKIVIKKFEKKVIEELLKIVPVVDTQAPKEFNEYSARAETSNKKLNRKRNME